MPRIPRTRLPGSELRWNSDLTASFIYKQEFPCKPVNVFPIVPGLFNTLSRRNAATCIYMNELGTFSYLERTDDLIFIGSNENGISLGPSKSI